METDFQHASAGFDRFDRDIDLRDAALAAGERALQRGDGRFIEALAAIRADRDMLVAGRAATALAAGRRETVWLDCRDLYVAGLPGTKNHAADALVPGEAECHCARDERESAYECARPEERAIPDSRFALRICCACAYAWETAAAKVAGQPANGFGLRDFHRLPLLERRTAERRLLARVCRILLAEQGSIGTWHTVRIEVAQ